MVKTKDVLEQENIILRKQLEDREKAIPASIDLDSIERRIRQKGKPSANSIQVVERHDHKNITLWTKDGNPIGPLHPDNAVQTLRRFKNELGVILLADRPTDAQVEAYKQTDEYKQKIKAEVERRARKEKSKRKGGVDRLISAMEKLYGVDKSQMNVILKPEEVK